MSKDYTFRLNLKLFTSRLAAFLAMDIFICLIFVCALLYSAEINAAGLVLSAQPREAQETQTEALSVAGYTIEVTGGPPIGGKPPKIIARFLPDATAEASRSFSLAGEPSGFFETLSSIRYRLMQPQGEGTLAVTADVGRIVVLFAVSAIIVLVWQALSLLGAIVKNSRDVARILQPLRELTATTKTLSGGGRLTPDELSKLAAALDSIGATQLDARLPLRGVKEELRPLAVAINELLQRIDETYSSQIKFISDASHELRTPIAVIQGYANLLTRWGAEDPETMQESINAIKSEADAMKDLVEQLLFLARWDNDSMHVVMERLNLSGVAAETLREVEMIDPSHVFTSELEDEVWVNVDRGLIKQLLRILIDNSIKHTPAGGQITLIVRREGQEAILAVRDEGDGIASQDLPYVFDRFYRSDASRNRDTGGTGLGLAIAKWIIERHGGYIRMMSMEKLGTKTTVCLPAEQ